MSSKDRRGGYDKSVSQKDWDSRNEGDVIRKERDRHDEGVSRKERDSSNKDVGRKDRGRHDV